MKDTSSSNKVLHRVCYFGICDMSYSRNAVYANALKLNGVEVIECTSKEKGLRRYIDLFRKHGNIKDQYDAMIVGFPGFVVAPFARLISKKKVILDALSSRYDSDIVSRNAHEGSAFKKLKILFVDWLAFVCAHRVLVETEHQKRFISKKFNISPKKLLVVYTGTDENKYQKDKIIQKCEKFTVLFRGRIMNEAGVPAILKAAEILKDEDIHFDIIGYGWGPWIEESRKIYAGLDHDKVRWTEEEQSCDELVRRTRMAHVALGQFGDNERLDRTIPHKAFEAMIMGIPYITGNSAATVEIMEDGQECIFVPRNSPASIAKAILSIKNDRELTEQLSRNIEEKYWNTVSNKIIGDILKRHIEEIL